MILKRILSYLYPIIIEKRTSEWSKSLEVTMVNGRLLMDSKNTNYSFGSLQKVLRKGLLQIDRNQLKSCEHILLLGVAAGSVIQTLQNEFDVKGKIIGIEIDPVAIELANSYFELEKKDNVTILNTDAFEYIDNSDMTFDLIIVDLFKDTEMDDQLYSDSFWSKTHKLLNENSLCVFNSMPSLSNVALKNERLMSVLNLHYSDIKTIKAQKQHNQLFILKA